MVIKETIECSWKIVNSSELLVYIDVEENDGLTITGCSPSYSAVTQPTLTLET